ncbi:S8 family serine peptidase [Sinorhizobium meliloti]|uniref:S8/S53 family peptidase n=1 Tax=Rhizobium meliloti TaxID=382 RepID=UPI001296122F|nr:S8/S53 family peptidase [Sinorhizobium meliloti]MQV32025.1 S8 family serine peptidase [Sinorhizobium meliloti]
MWRFLTAAIASLFAWSSFAETAMRPLSNEEEVVGWVATNSRIAGLPNSVEELIVGMHNLGILPIRQTVSAPNVSEPTVSDRILAEFPFFNWTDRVDNLICDINPDSCYRRRRSSSITDYGNLMGHVSGFAVTPAAESVWYADHDTPLNIPDIKFQQRAAWHAFEVPRDGPIEHLYNRDALGCRAITEPGEALSTFGSLEDLRRGVASNTDKFCPALIASFHQSYWLYVLSEKANAYGGTSTTETGRDLYRLTESMLREVHSQSGTDPAWRALEAIFRSIYDDAPPHFSTMRLPVFSLYAAFSVSEVQPHYSGLRGGQVEPPVPGGTRWRNYVLNLSSEDRINLLNELETVDLSRATASGGKADSAVTVSGAEMNDELFRKQKASVFEPINFQTDKLSLVRSVPRTIIFVDDGLDLNHCVFKGKCKARFVENESLSAPTGPDKEELEQIKQEIEDVRKSTGHGHGVAAVAVAPPSNGAMLGIDPLAQAVLFPMHLGRWEAFQFDTDAEKLLERLLTSSDPPGMIVWNLSGHTREREANKPIDKFLARVAGKKRNPAVDFFVFSAGNTLNKIVEDDKITGDCTVFPACRSKNFFNVITVVGAMLDGNRWPIIWRDPATGEMSYTNPDFEIAAIAKNVVIPSRTTEAFFFAEGTSYAAPQVAAVVAQLRAQMLAPPETVEGRLMACGKMSRALENEVRGGLLDVSCTLKSDMAQVAFKPAEGDETDPKVAKSLRSATVRGIWSESGAPTDSITLTKEAGGKISGQFGWWVKSSTPSILGYRQFVDDPESFKLAVWDESNTIDVETRGRIKASQVMEVLFEGDTKPNCIPVENVLAFIPASPPYVNQQDDQTDVRDSVCKDFFDR